MVYPGSYDAFTTKVNIGDAIVNEGHTVPASGPYEITLLHKPRADSPSTIVVTGSITPVYTETTNPIPALHQYHVDYLTGVFTFNAGDTNDNLQIDYFCIGDDVLAEHVNVLQSTAVDNIEHTLGLNPQGTAGTVNNRITVIMQPSGVMQPNVVNRVNVVDQAISGAKIESTTDADKISNANIKDATINLTTKVTGQLPNANLAQIQDASKIQDGLLMDAKINTNADIATTKIADDSPEGQTLVVTPTTLAHSLSRIRSVLKEIIGGATPSWLDAVPRTLNQLWTEINTARGSMASLDTRLDVAMNDDGTVKSTWLVDVQNNTTLIVADAKAINFATNITVTDSGSGVAKVDVTSTPTFTNFALNDQSNSLMSVNWTEAGASATSRYALVFRRAKGTIAVPQTVVANDNLGDIQFFGHNGTAYYQSAGIIGAVESVGGFNVDGRLEFQTSNGGTLATRMVISKFGDVGIGSGVTPSYTLHVRKSGGAGVAIEADASNLPILMFLKGSTTFSQGISTADGSFITSTGLSISSPITKSTSTEFGVYPNVVLGKGLPATTSLYGHVSTGIAEDRFTIGIKDAGTSETASIRFGVDAGLATGSINLVSGNVSMWKMLGSGILTSNGNYINYVAMPTGLSYLIRSTVTGAVYPNSNFYILAGGNMAWGPGNTAMDTYLSRGGVGTLSMEPASRLNSSSGTFKIGAGTDLILESNGTTEGARLTASGNFGIGINPTVKLDVNGNLRLGNTGTISTSAGDLLLAPTTNEVKLYNGTSTYALSVYNASTRAIKLDANSVSWLNGGDVAIGQTTASARLHVNGNAEAVATFTGTTHVGVSAQRDASARGVYYRLYDSISGQIWRMQMAVSSQDFSLYDGLNGKTPLTIQANSRDGLILVSGNTMTLQTGSAGGMTILTGDNTDPTLTLTRGASRVWNMRVGGYDTNRAFVIRDVDGTADRFIINTNGLIGVGIDPATSGVRFGVSGQIASWASATGGGYGGALIDFVDGVGARIAGTSLSPAVRPPLTFFTNDAERMRINALSGNISINENQDTYKLGVAGTGRFTGNLATLASLQAYGGSIGFDSASYNYSRIGTSGTGNKDIIFATDNVTHMTINSVGEFGIGASPATGTKLFVNGTRMVFNGNADMAFAFTSSWAFQRNWSIRSVGGAGSGLGRFTINDDTAGGVERINIDSTGQFNVLGGSLSVTGATNGIIQLNKGASGNNSNINFSTALTNKWHVGLLGDDNFRVMETATSFTPLYVRAGALSNTVDVGPNGLGIGGQANTKLDVIGASATAVSARVYGQGTNTSLDISKPAEADYGYLILNTRAGTRAGEQWRIGTLGDNNLSIYDHQASAGFTYPVTIQHDTPDNTLRISSTGVGIGGGASYKLHVQQSGDATIGITSGNTNNSIIVMGDVADNNKCRIIYNNNTDFLTMSTNGTEKIRINSAGSIQIGNTADVTGDKLQITGDSGGTPANILLNDTNGTNPRAWRFLVSGKQLIIRDHTQTVNRMTFGADNSSYSTIDINQNQLINHVAHRTLPGSVTSPQLGQIIFDTTVGQNNLKLYDGSSWVTVASANAVGLDKYVQFNDGGVFGGNAGLQFDKATGTAGRLGIGGTPDANYKLFIGTLAPQAIKVQNTNGGCDINILSNIASGSCIYFGNATVATGGAIIYYNTNYAVPADADSMQFNTVSTPQMKIDNVGDITAYNGSIYIAKSSGAQLKFYNTDGDKIQLVNTTSGSKIAHSSGWSVDMYAGVLTPSQGLFKWFTSNASSAWTERMRLDNGGNLGLNVTPLTKLHVRSASGIRLDTSATDGFVLQQVNANDWGLDGLTASSILRIRNSSLYVENGNIDLSKNQLKNASIHNVTSSTRPASPVVGQIIYETDTTNVMTYDGVSWKNLGALVEKRENYISTGQTLFNLVSTYQTNAINLKVFIDGQLMLPGAGNDYLETSSSSVTFNFTVPASKIVTFVWVATAGAVSQINEYRKEFIATAGQTIFSTSPDAFGTGGVNAQVFVDGVLKKVTTDYVETDTQTITFNSGLTIGQKVTIVWRIGAVAGTASYLGGYGVNAVPTASTILPLNSNAKVPSSAVESTEVTAVPVDHFASGTKIPLTNGASTMNFGDVGFINSSGTVTIGNASAIATANVTVMACENISAGGSGKYLLLGVASDSTWAWTAGGKIYLSTTGTTGNTLTQTAPSANNNVVQVLGVATHAGRILFNPNLAQVEITA